MRLGLACLLLALPACTALKARVMADRVSRGLAVEGYRGRVTERGLLRDDPDGVVVRDLVYARGWRLRAEVVEPRDQAGELFVCDGESIVLWWPRFFFGLRIRGLEAPDEDDLDDAVLAGCEWLLERYEPRGPGRATIAGRAAEHWRLVPRGRGEREYGAWFDAETDLPLALRVEGDGARPWYAMAFDALDLDAPARDDDFRLELPAGALVYEWDLAAPGVTLEEARRRVDFPVLVPARLPEGHEVRKVVLSATDDPLMVALLMQRGARWLSLSEMPNMGPILVPPIGIPVPLGREEGVLSFAPGFAVISWSVGNTFLTLIGNLPYPELLDVAASVGPPP